MQIGQARALCPPTKPAKPSFLPDCRGCDLAPKERQRGRGVGALSAPGETRTQRG